MGPEQCGLGFQQIPSAGPQRVHTKRSEEGVQVTLVRYNLQTLQDDLNEVRTRAEEQPSQENHEQQQQRQHFFKQNWKPYE